MTRRDELRSHVDLWVASRSAYEALARVVELEERSAYKSAMLQLFSAELDAAEHLHQAGITVQRRAEEDPPSKLGLGEE